MISPRKRKPFQLALTYPPSIGVHQFPGFYLSPTLVSATSVPWWNKNPWVFVLCVHPILGVQLAYAKSYGLISIPGFDHGSYVTHLQDQTIKQTIKQTVRLCPSLKKHPNRVYHTHTIISLRYYPAVGLSSSPNQTRFYLDVT